MMNAPFIRKLSRFFLSVAVLSGLVYLYLSATSVVQRLSEAHSRHCLYAFVTALAATISWLLTLRIAQGKGTPRAKTRTDASGANDAGRREPVMDDLPHGTIDWDEISTFILDMLAPDRHCRKGWKTIDDPSMTESLQENSVAVLHTLHDDLYGCFYHQHDERFKVWNRMERFIRTKYSGLSDKALSSVIDRYQMDDIF